MAKKKKAKGLGDTLHNVFEATGIDKVAKYFLGDDCGCENRRQKLNELIKYKVPQCITHDQYIYLDKWFKDNKKSVTRKDQKELLEIYNHVYFYKKKTLTSCSKCLSTTIGELHKVYNEFKTEIENEQKE